MGRTITPKYRLVIDGLHPMDWHRKPTMEALASWIAIYHISLHLGGCNAHISKSLGYIPFVNSARIEENRRDGRVLVEWHAATFQGI